MNKKELVELGIEDADVQKAILKSHGLGIEALKAENEELKNSEKVLKESLDKANQAIEEFGKIDHEGLKTQVEEYKTKAEEAEQQRLADVSKLKFDYALEKTLTNAKAKNIKSVKALLDMDALELGEDGSISGLDEQLETITNENAFLFDVVVEEEEPEPKITTKIQSKNILGDPTVSAAREAAGVTSK